MAPIAIKELGTDSVTGLQRTLYVWNLNIDAETEIISVGYDVCLLSNGIIVKTELKRKYYRFNCPQGFKGIGAARRPVEGAIENLKFDALRNSQLGQEITALIQSDINAYDGTPESLEQN